MTFDIDANGILKVTALDKATGRSQHITITASSGLNDDEVDRMRQDAEAHAEEDRKRKALIEARNNADSLAYSAEKVLKDLGDKVPADMRTKVEDGVAKVRSVLDSEDLEAIQKASDELNEVVQQVGAAAYQQEGPVAGAPGEEPAEEGPAESAEEADDEDVVEGEFRDA